MNIHVRVPFRYLNPTYLQLHSETCHEKNSLNIELQLSLTVHLNLKSQGANITYDLHEEITGSIGQKNDDKHCVAKREKFHHIYKQVLKNIYAQ